VIAGGELTLDMLDLRYDASGHYYEAPLHVKALSGCFIIDDFGRQLVSPTNLLNRWIVPLENRVDFLKLHTGKTLTIPFEELIIFSTNLEPEDLMDPAFLRRLPYKIEVGPPTKENYRTIFEKECAVHGFEIPPISSKPSSTRSPWKKAWSWLATSQVRRRPGGGQLPLHADAAALRSKVCEERAGQPARAPALADQDSCVSLITAMASADSPAINTRGLGKRLELVAWSTWPALRAKRIGSGSPWPPARGSFSLASTQSCMPSDMVL